MKAIIRISFALTILLQCTFTGKSQTVLNDKLIKIDGWEVRHLDNPFFREYFEVIINQQLDHDDPKAGTFKQRFCVGYNGLDVPNIMDLDGYAIDYAARKGYTNELSKTLKCNMVVIEHRYFGKSTPAKPDWKYLTIKQAANDCHAIKKVLETMMKGKWLVSGVSKGGQTALAYRMYYPNDTEGAIVFGTPVRKDAEDARLVEYFTKAFETPGGKEVLDYQKRMLQNKSTMLPLFERFVKEKNLTFGKKDIEFIYENSVLYYSFCYYQNCESRGDIPSDTASKKTMMKALFDVVPARFFSDENKTRSDASFYMFYNELGYYEYDIKPFAGLLKGNSYSNIVFCPENVKMKFNKTYLTELNTYQQKTMTKTIFVYGQKDPWASMQPDVKPKKENFKYIVANGCHKTKLADMDLLQRKEIYKSISTWLGCKFPEEK